MATHPTSRPSSNPNPNPNPNSSPSPNANPNQVTFEGEGAQDVGGPYREALDNLCAELHSEALPLLVRSPNCVHGAGGNREVYVPNPSALGANELDWYCFVGQLLGLALRQRETQVHTGRHY